MDIKKATTQFAVALTKAVAALQMYDAYHPSVRPFANTASNALEMVFEQADHVEFSQSQGELYLGTSRIKGLKGSEKVVEALEELQITKVRISRGTDANEFFALLELLCSDAAEVLERGKLRVEALDSLPHVAIDGMTRRVGANTNQRTLSEGEIVDLKPVPTGHAPQLPEGYRLLGQLGEGGQGAIYKVRNQSADRMEACKSLTVAHPEKRKTFVREIRHQGKLTHQSIGQIYYVDPNFNYYLMEYLPGGTMRQRLDAAKKPTLEEIAFWIRDALQAVGYAHGHGVVHRDIKPENILFDVHGDPKVCDFGIAASVTSGDKQLAGTPHYMAPEQWNMDGTVDNRVDIWAFGVVLYEALTGVRPFDGGNAITIGTAATTQPPAHFDPTKLSKTALGLMDVALRALQKDPDLRYPNADAFATAIQSRMFSDATSAARTSGSRVVPIVPPKGAEALGKAMLGIAMIAVLSVLWMIFGPGDDKATIALDELRETTQDKTLTFERRIDACTKYLSDYSMASGEQREEVRRMRKDLKVGRHASLHGKRRLADLPGVIEQFLQQEDPEAAQRELDRFAGSEEAKSLPKLKREVAKLQQVIDDGRDAITEVRKKRQKDFDQLIDRFDALCREGNFRDAFATSAVKLRRLTARDRRMRQTFDTRLNMARARQRTMIDREERKIHAALDARDWEAAEGSIMALERLGASGGTISAQRFAITRARADGEGGGGTPTMRPTIAMERGPYVFLVQREDGFTCKGVALNDKDAKTLEVQLQHVKLSLKRKRVRRIVRLSEENFEPTPVPREGYKDTKLGFVIRRPDRDGWEIVRSTGHPLLLVRFENKRKQATIDLLLEARVNAPYVNRVTIDAHIKRIRRGLRPGVRTLTTRSMAWVGGLRAFVFGYRMPGARRAESWSMQETIWDTSDYRFTLSVRAPDDHFPSLTLPTAQVRRSFQLIPRKGDGTLAKRHQTGRKVMELIAEAEVAAGQAKHSEAAASYGQAVELFPEWADLQYRYSLALTASGQHEQAMLQAEAAYKLDKGSEIYRRHFSARQARRGDELIEAGKTKEGIQLHEKAYRLVKRIDGDGEGRRRFGDAYNNIATDLLKERKESMAIEVLKKALALVPTDGRYRRNIAQAYYRQGLAHFQKKRYRTAKGRLEQALKYYPHSGARSLLVTVKAAMKE